MARRLSKNDRVLSLIALLATASFVVGGIVAVVTGDQAATLEAAQGQLSALRQLTDDLTASIRRQQSALDDHVFSRTTATHQRLTDAVERERASSVLIPDATAGLPDVRATLDALEAASADWYSRVAIPAVAAVQVRDTVALASYAARAGEDHALVDVAIERASRALDRVAVALGTRRATDDAAQTVGIVVAFGFLALAFGGALVVVRRFGRALEREARQASVLNQFTEVTSFATGDAEVASSSLIALGRLTSPDAAVTHILDRSMDRAIPDASTGDAVAEILPMRALDRCAGVVRGTMFVADDLSDDLSVHCPIYPATVGTLACIPLDSGELIGAVHLYWKGPYALPLDRRPSMARITEHAALAIGNRRLLAALHGQANTDPRTGLANSRAFDLALELALLARARHESLTVLMLDIDQFKQFNDRHGHPAGDEALRAFGAVLRSCMREGDVAARYGGEEFAVLLPGVDEAVGEAVAERIRARTEATIIALSPGITDHITVSIGISSAPDQALDRIALMRLADEALYRAKQNGRNRVVSGRSDGPVPVPLAAAARAAARKPDDRTRQAS
jgi:diguanylate cyclase (GGDEF)-like protein